MKTMLCLSLAPLFLALAATAAEPARCYEMRVYYAAPGKLDALNARFRNHTTKLFEKHGMRNVGYWVPVNNTDNKLIYILETPSREAAKAAWKAFGSDPEWKQVVKETQKDGILVTKADSIYLTPTDFSPAIKAGAGETPRVFELRTYTASPGNLTNLLARFRNHTVKLFEKHGMTNFGYWTPMDTAKGSENTLIYLLAHASQEAAADSFKRFREDPEWVAARKASEEKAGGSLTTKVESVFLKPVDYSPAK